MSDLVRCSEYLGMSFLNSGIPCFWRSFQDYTSSRPNLCCLTKEMERILWKSAEKAVKFQAGESAASYTNVDTLHTLKIKSITSESPLYSACSTYFWHLLHGWFAGLLSSSIFVLVSCRNHLTRKACFVVFLKTSVAFFVADIQVLNHKRHLSKHIVSTL